MLNFIWNVTIILRLKKTIEEAMSHSYNKSRYLHMQNHPCSKVWDKPSMCISFIHFFSFNCTNLKYRWKINAKTLCLKKKVVIKRSSAIKVVAQYIGGISFPIQKEYVAFRIKDRREINFSLSFISAIHFSCEPIHCGTSLAGTPELFLFGIVFLLLY